MKSSSITDQLSDWGEQVVVSTPPPPTGPRRGAALPALIVVLTLILGGAVALRASSNGTDPTMTADAPASSSFGPGTSLPGTLQVAGLSRTTDDGVELNLSVDSASPMLQRYMDRISAGGSPTACVPDRAYRLTVGVDGQPASRPNSAPELEQVMYPASPLAATFAGYPGLATDPEFQVLANAYVVRAYDDSIESVTIVVGGAPRDRAPVEQGWAVLGFRTPPAVDGNVMEASGVGDSVGLTLHRDTGDEYLNLTNLAPPSGAQVC